MTPFLRGHGYSLYSHQVRKKIEVKGKESPSQRFGNVAQNSLSGQVRRWGDKRIKGACQSRVMYPSHAAGVKYASSVYVCLDRLVVRGMGI